MEQIINKPLSKLCGILPVKLAWKSEKSTNYMLQFLKEEFDNKGINTDKKTMVSS